ncbi:alpha-hydroxy-acid oxidizing protein [Cystobacter fuscus]
MKALSLRELEAAARALLEPGMHDFFAGGSDDEVSLRANEDAFARVGLVPRVLRGRGAPGSTPSCSAAAPPCPSSSRPPPSTGWPTPRANAPRLGPPRPRAPSTP